MPTREELRSVQGPLKERYQLDADAAVIVLDAEGTLGEEAISCRVDTGRALVEAGLHPSTGGDGSLVCSGDMLLQALVACAGVTLRAVATSLGVELRNGVVRAEGDLDVRGTLGVSSDAPVGFRDIRLSFELDTDASEDELNRLIDLTERFCVVYRTLRDAPRLEVSHGVMG